VIGPDFELFLSPSAITSFYIYFIKSYAKDEITLHIMYVALKLKFTLNMLMSLLLVQ